MKRNDFEKTIQQLFGDELLKEDDEYGFTNTTDGDIQKIGYATNLSIETVEMAIAQGVDLLLTHHDAWDFIYGLREACVSRLKQYNIGHFWIHAPLDFVDFGTCTSLMKMLKVDEIEAYSTYSEADGELPGIGEFTTPVEFEQLAKRMRGTLNEPVRAWKNNAQPVKRVGVLTGAGHSSALIREAAERGCDTYVTGEATLYSIQYAQYAGINLLVGSHTFTEIFGVESLAKKIAELNPGVEITELIESHFELNH
ncbi:Nif3-like dinuclear metal center hexameric protein [Planococcus maritimus]|uniref:Nif3-like dinuclear metal center hexameric protein n=1 Tax=Planococcus maritimus TaxID=192421 RepID=UPI00233112F6|nr:Nif3-like dinuclear metal center hexameric protein [Planococcus maritimus]